jgi:hypothetical protein
MKRRALAGFWKRAGLDVTGGRPWHPTSKLLSYLTGL